MFRSTVIAFGVFVLRGRELAENAAGDLGFLGNDFPVAPDRLAAGVKLLDDLETAARLALLSATSDSIGRVLNEISTPSNTAASAPITAATSSRLCPVTFRISSRLSAASHSRNSAVEQSHHLGRSMEPLFGLDHVADGEAIFAVSVLTQFDQIGRTAHRAHELVELVDAGAVPMREYRHVPARERRLPMRDRVQRDGKIGDQSLHRPIEATPEMIIAAPLVLQQGWRHDEDEPLQLLAGKDLATQPTRRSPLSVDHVQHLVLERARRAETFRPNGIGCDMTGRAGKRAAAIAMDARHARIARGPHQVGSRGDIRADFAAIGITPGYERHCWSPCISPGAHPRPGGIRKGVGSINRH
ncbi:hypothetical protein [Paracoccus versutus]|uniref:hypothetical protein n=1 Tax=Paracoccus versutus TaxID=34007 RepID=UPI0035A67660